MSITLKCKIDGCKYSLTTSSRRSMCQTHYIESRNNPDTPTREQLLKARPAIIEGDIAKIPLGVNAKGGYTIVDADMAWLSDKHKWSLSSTGYAETDNRDKGSVKIRMHRLVLDILDTERYADHINGDRLDNRRSNLRIVTHRQNLQNTKPRSENGYKGVSRTGNRWRAYISPHKKQIHLGVFATSEEAAKAYDNAAREHFGEYAYLNFPELL